MEGVVAALTQLLEREREAALRADIDLLLELQPQKQALVAGLRKGEHGERVIDELVVAARSNVRLIRQVVLCLRGALGIAGESTYTPSGQYQVPMDRSLRGVL